VRFVNAAATATSATPAIPAKTQRGHIGLVVAVSIAAGVAVGLVLDLSVFAGGSEPQIIGKRTRRFLGSPSPSTGRT
jgi:hypothetical protein